MQNKQWIVRPKKSNNIIEQLLVNRDITDCESFLNPNFEHDIYDPFLLHDMSKSVKRIFQAIKNKEKIGVFADYDVDGVTAGAILTNFFKYLNVDTKIYIPTRDEGYGLNEAGIKNLYDSGCKLVITVDLGITGKKQINYAKKLGLDVIITDHHSFKKSDISKDAFGIIHSRLSDKYPNKDLSGGGVAWKLVQAMASSPDLSKICNDKKIKNIVKWFLDLAAISTVCDMVSLAGENRAIVKFGIKVISKTQNTGLSELIKKASIKTDNISTYTIGFQIGPRLNAPGRLDHALISYFLLTTRDKNEAKKFATKLDDINYQRQKELEQVFKEAKSKIETRKLKNKKIILIEDKNWSEGLIGLVAGRLMEELCRPVIVFREEKGHLKGSARSIESFHILEALDSVSKYLITHGGHARAAGLSLEKKHLSVLYDEILEIAESKLSPRDLVPKIYIDAEINLEDITLKLLRELEKFEPHGLGNPRPVFLAKNITIANKRLIGADNKHIKLGLTVNEDKSGRRTNVYDAIGFDMGYLYDKIKSSERADLVFSLAINSWNNTEKPQIRIMDIKINDK
jgi:single-stranded-DNA-specific exonuclease